MLVTEGSFYKIVQDTWSSTLGFGVDHPAPAEPLAADALTVCVRIAGAWEGEVQLHCSPQLARRIAAVIFQVDANQAGTSEIFDALSELIHIVGGNLKPLLPRPVSLSFPALADSRNWGEAAPQWQTVCCLTLMSEGHPFVVTLLGDPLDSSKAEPPAEGQGQQPRGSW